MPTRRPGRPDATELTYAEALRLLEARGFGIKPDRSRIEALVDLLDHPELTYPTVHLAGTNGKSSTARMVGSILAAHGLVAGVYTSPHLQSVRERFLLAGPAGGGLAEEIVAPDQLAALVGYLLPFVELVEERGDAVTYFELTTAIAFEWMATRSVGAGVFETGLGGTWDATNVVRPQVAVLTRVAVDHAALLGPTPLDNAREKVGIVKPGARVVAAPQDPDVLELLVRTAAAAGAPLTLVGRDLHLVDDRPAVAGRSIALEGARARYDELFVPLFGAHQAANAALAVAACEEFLDRGLDPEALRAGLAAVTSPGRMEVVRRDPLVVLDGAHNPDAARLLGPALIETFGDREVTLVLAVFDDKDVEGICEALLPWASRAILTASASPRSADPARLAARAEARGLPHRVVPGLGAAVEAAMAAAGEGGLVVVSGSLHAVGEARDLLVGPVA